jgi:hypothetical protein
VPTIVPIVDLAYVKAAGWKDIDPRDDDVLAACIDAATADIESRISPRRIVQATYTLEPYDGDAAKGRWGQFIFLDQYPVTTLTTVKENGVTLVTGSGYDSAGTKDVLLYATRGILLRKAGTTSQLYQDQLSGRVQRAWAGGVQNVEVTYTAGYPDPITECADLARVCSKLAALYYRNPRRAGQNSSQRSTGGTSYINDLSEAELAVIDRYAPWGRPRCRMAA